MENKKCVIALGFFDGVHIGHKALLDMTVQRAREKNLEPAVISFDSHPDARVTGKPVPLINSALDRKTLISRKFGIEDFLVIHFDEKLMHMEWDRFIDWLVCDFNAAHLVAGYDFRFGYKGAGNVELLKARCAEIGIGCDIVPKVTLDGQTVSSTLIRKLLADGEMERAVEFLGHPYCLTDFVRDGFRLGRTIGVPTINMRYDEDVLIPAHGVYVTKAILTDGSEYPAVTNVGVRPTVSGDSRVSVESYLLDYSGNLYGEQVRVEFYKFLRPEQKFSDITALKEQISRDIEATKAYFEEK